MSIWLNIGGVFLLQFPNDVELVLQGVHITENKNEALSINSIDLLFFFLEHFMS